MALSAGSASTGLTFWDRNGYTVTLTCFERDAAPAFDTTLTKDQIFVGFGGITECA